MATIDYMIASYGPYSASATGGNALARDFLAGIAAMYSTPSMLSRFRCTRFSIDMMKSVRTYRPALYSRMAVNYSCYPCYFRYCPDLHLLLERAANSR
jgi:hypothetical protein